MTVIAWDGKTLAADKMSSSVGYAYTVTKVYRLSDGSIAAFTGGGDHAMALLAWLNGLRLPADYPKAQETNDTSALVIAPTGRVLSYGATPHPQTIEGRYYAAGHGRDFALAAMHLGYSAEIAVKIACELDIYCGKGVDTLTLEGQCA